MCVAGGGSAVLSLLFVYPEFPNTKLLAFNLNLSYSRFSHLFSQNLYMSAEQLCK